MTGPTFGRWLPVAPALVVIAACLLLPLAVLALESLRPFVDGRAQSSGFTVQHYADLAQPAYAFYFYDTFRIGALTSLWALALGAPIAWIAARTRRRGLRTAILALLIGLLFMSLVARLYAIHMAFGPFGPLAWFGHMLGVHPARPAFAPIHVTLGLLHLVLPIVALTLIGAFQNLDPRLEEAAQTLGASRLRVLVDVTLPLALPGLASAFLVAFALCVSNFVVPLILGRGVVLFTTNLMYVRISEVANFPSGAAIGVVMLALSALIVWALIAATARLARRISA